MLCSPRTAPMSVARASPIWLLCAQTSAFASGPPCFEQVLERLGHVAVAQVPALRAAVVHDPVVVLGRGDQPRVHRRVEHLAVAVLSSARSSRSRHCVDHLPSRIRHSRGSAPRGRRLRVRPATGSGSRSARARPRPPRGRARRDRRAPPRSSPTCCRCRGRRTRPSRPARAPCVELAQIADQPVDHGVAPHPGREARERPRRASRGAAGGGRSGRSPRRRASRPRPRRS